MRSRVAEQDWHRLLDLVSAGPPLWSPLRWVDGLANGLEMFAHHEDVRRAADGWQPRALGAAQARLARYLPVVKRNYRKSPVRVELRIRGGRTFVAGRDGDATVRLTGEPGELLLHAIGRSEVILDAEGDPNDIAAVHATDRTV